MWEQVSTLFAEMGWVSAVLLLVGVAFASVEVFLPGFGVWGITGSICVVLGIVARMIEGASITQLFILIFIVLIIFTLLFLLMIRSARHGLLSRTAIIETGVSVKETENEKDELVGKLGKTTTMLRPVGKIDIDGVTYCALTEEGYINENVDIEVVRVEGENIFVKIFD